jgi:hypothetical protein
VLQDQRLKRGLSTICWAPALTWMFSDATLGQPKQSFSIGSILNWAPFAELQLWHGCFLTPR